MQGLGNLCKAQHEPTVIVAQAQKLLNLLHTRGSCPLLNSLDLALFYTNATCTNHVAQELTGL